MSFIDLTGRHSVGAIGTPPTLQSSGGPGGGAYTDFDGTGCLSVTGNMSDFVYGAGPLCVEMVVYVYPTLNLYDTTSSSKILDAGSSISGDNGLQLNGDKSTRSFYNDPAGWDFSGSAGWRQIRWDIDAGGVARVFVDGVLKVTSPNIFTITNYRDGLYIGGWNGFAGYYTRCKIAALRITRTSRNGQPFDLSSVGSAADPQWDDTVLLLRLDGSAPSSRTTVTSITDVTAATSGWTTDTGNGPKTISGTLSAPLASGESVSVSLDAGTTWSPALASGMTWTFTDTTDHATSWYVFSRVVAANGLSGETSTVQITLVPPVEKLPNPYPPRITSEHAVRPRFMSMVDMLTQHVWDTTQAANALPSQFDLDAAVGAQLDIIGEWVGQSRALRVPIPSVWFSFDTAGLGFDEGVWKGPYDATTGLTLLPDEPYRLLLRARIATNSWDGTRQSAVEAWAVMFDGTGVTFKIKDNGDMSMEVLIYTDHPLDAITKALVTGGYLGIKPAGVEITNYTIIEV